MFSSNVIGIAVIAGAVLAIFLGIAFTVAKLWVRADKETALVRTGSGGPKVIQDGGAVVLPVFQQVMKVSLGTQKLTIQRRGPEALITKDKLRADVTVEFFVRVRSDKDAIQSAAQTLGARVNDPTALKELVEGKFVDSLRAVAAKMDLEELHASRSSFVQQVRQTAEEDLLKNGLELESASLVGLDQTGDQFFNPKNTFDAEGLRKITQMNEGARLQRETIILTTETTIAQKTFEATQLRLGIERDTEKAKIEQAQALASMRADQSAVIAKTEAERKQEADTARIEADRKTRAAEIARDRDVELAEQDRQVALAAKAEERAAADAKASAARAEAATAEESIKTAREVAEADRGKRVALVLAEQEAGQKAIGITLAAKAEQEAAMARASAVTTAAEADAAAAVTRAKAQREVYEVEAAGKRSLNEAANTKSEGVLSNEVRVALIAALPGILEAAGKPMEKIDSIRLFDMGGVGAVANGGEAGGSSGNLADQAVGAAMRYRVMSPLLEQLAATVGLDVKDGIRLVPEAIGLPAAPPAAPAPVPNGHDAGETAPVAAAMAQASPQGRTSRERAPTTRS